MTRLLMIDSGAFSVWTQGAVINLGDYIRFCCANPAASYYVNLDVIPGVANNKKTLTKENIEASCKQGWENYLNMIKELPKDKVIPVYHQNDPIRWLLKYIDYGTRYIGISPANDNTTQNKMNWMDQKEGGFKVNEYKREEGLRKYLFTGAGKPVVKTHGFAVTSYELMNLWQWHSVDSASWKLQAAWGAIYIPQSRGGQYDYTKPPIVIAVSPMSPLKHKSNEYHLDGMVRTPKLEERMLAYLKEVGVSLGKMATRQESSSYKLNLTKGELWFSKKDRIVMEELERGVVTSLEDRLKVTSYFIKQANKVLPVDHIYFAGAPMPYPLEYKLGRRLLSYHIVSKSDNKCLKKHLRLMEKNNGDYAR